MIKFSVQMMNVGGEQSLTAPAREMLLKLIIYARRELTRNHQTTGKYNTAFNALQGYFSSVFVFCQLSQVKMLSHFHQQNSPLCPVSSPRQHTSVPDHVLFSSVQFSSVPGKNKDILQLLFLIWTRPCLAPHLLAALHKHLMAHSHTGAPGLHHVLFSDGRITLSKAFYTPSHLPARLVCSNINQWILGQIKHLVAMLFHT